MKTGRSIILALLLAAANFTMASSCDKSGVLDALDVTVMDTGNFPGKWSSGSDITAVVSKKGSDESVSRKVSVTDAASGTMGFSLSAVERTEHTVVIYSPSSLTIPAGQTSSTAEVRVGSTTLTPGRKGPAALSCDIKTVTAKVTVNVKSDSDDYSGWNLENVSLTAPSAICGVLSAENGSARIASGEKASILYEYASPSALRTKAQTASFIIYPSISKGSSVSLSYTLEKEGKRVEITHQLAFPESTSGGSTVTVEETIPKVIDGDWSAQGSGVKYQNVFPGKDWETTTPESRGYSSKKLEQFRQELMNTAAFTTTSMMVAVGGKVIFSYGDIKENVKIASCRKSLLSTLYGKYVENGTVDLDKTLAELGIDEDENSWGGRDVNWDGGALLPSEKEATIKDLLTARSGCFHKPANSGDDHSYMTAADRGKYKHGTYYLYNNWDFNCAGGVFEMLTGKDIYAAFKEDIADPCGWQDYDLSIQSKTEEYKGASRFLAYHFIISTRDMLRMALLMMNKGNWDGTQVVSEAWAEKITSVYTHRSEMHPSYRLSREFEYGWLWWTFCPEYGGYDPAIFEGGFTATGSGGQYITVLPALNMVIAHKDKTKSMEKSTYYSIIKKVAACKE